MPGEKVLTLLNQILDDTYILKSAIESEDLDVIETTLARREMHIDALETLQQGPVADSEVVSLLERFKEADQQCQMALKALMDKTEAAFFENKAEKRDLIKNKKVHGSYQMQVPEQNAGLTIDHKK